jgi:hypothetical protein
MKRGKKSQASEDEDDWNPDLAYAYGRILGKQAQWFSSPEDRARLDKLLKGAQRFGPSSMSRPWRRLSKARQRYVMALGVGSKLTAVYAETYRRKALNYWYEAVGWPGLIAQLVLWRAPHEAIMNAIMFERWHFVPDYCDHRKHWYFRQTVGRRPEGCPLHARTARQDRYRSRKAADLLRAGHR